MLPRLPPAILLLISSASIYGVKRLLDGMEVKAIAGTPEQAEQAKRHLRNMRLAGRIGAGSLVLGAFYYGYHSWLERPSPSATKIEKPGFYENQYGNDRDHVSVLNDEQRRREETNLKHLQKDYT